MYRKSSPRRAFVSRASRALFIAILASAAVAEASATGGTKPSSKPVARLISTTRHEAPARPERARQIARVAPSGGARYVTASAAVAAASGEERRAFDLINAERRARGRQPLTWDGSLTRVARYHSDNMARQGFFNHVDRNGSDLTDRAHAHGVGGWKALGENIAYNQGYDDPAGFAVQRWMTSSKHRENILNGDFTHAGLGVSRTADGRVFFTQVFMKR
jgi:uncharacterized protein YkwD